MSGQDKMKKSERAGGKADGSVPKVVLERTFRATAPEVWDLWTTKEGFESWWGPEGFHVRVHTMEPRVGGELFYDMIADLPEHVETLAEMDRPDSHETRGRFTAFEPHRRLAITHQIDFLPGVDPYPSTIVMELHPEGKNVRMVVTLDPLHDPEFTRMSKEGMESSLRKLERKYAAGA